MRSGRNAWSGMRIGRRRPKRAAILGCGPAGMFAAHAFVRAGWEITVYSKKRMSDLYGAQYLHAPIPGLPSIRTSVEYRLAGTIEGYREKVYGPKLPNAVEVSPGVLAGRRDAWDIRAAYRAAYSMYSYRIVPVTIDAAFLEGEFGNPETDRHWGAVLSSIPAPVLCRNPSHAFLSQKVYAAGDAPERGIFAPISCLPDTVLCDGTEDRAWYRISNVFGHCTAEWPDRRKPPFEGVTEVQKPIGTTCYCWEGRITRIGRYGIWMKGVLSHQAYDVAQKIAER
jgi:hypothetical protein